MDERKLVVFIAIEARCPDLIGELDGCVFAIIERALRVEIDSMNCDPIVRTII